MSTRNLVRAYTRLVEQDDVGYFPGDPLSKWLRDARDPELSRINVFSVADEIQVDRSTLLKTFVRLVSDGVMSLNWDFHCTECNAVAGSHRHLKDAAAVNHCPLCDVDFRNSLDRNVEVTFTPSETLYRVSRSFLDAEANRVREQHAAHAIRLPEVYVSGLDCLHVPLFREMFESETLSLRESLSIRQVCIMFTDIKGSTALYDRFGDSVAYGLIRDHFEILFHGIEKHDGVVVKTIGDAVMASFRKPSDGVAAAIAIQHDFSEYNRRENIRDQIYVKIGLHSGSTIMVNLNNRIDYFGQTVNMAARIQATAGGGEIIVSEAVRNDPASVGLLRTAIRSLTRRSVVLKGITGAQAVFRLNFPDDSATARANSNPATVAASPRSRVASPHASPGPRTAT